MLLTKDRIGGLIFLVLALAYGYQATLIPLLPGDEYEPMNAATLPTVLAWVCGGLSFLQIVLGSGSADNKVNLVGLDFALVTKLLLLTLAFGFSLYWVGFAVSTALFLMVGYWFLGERRIKTILLASVPVAAAFWVLLVYALDVYLAPGQLFVMLGGA
ncbi:MAG: tripartite tricarboxylate transporter TctB family protein [Pontibacterium sp.]